MYDKSLGQISVPSSCYYNEKMVVLLKNSGIIKAVVGIIT